MLSTNLWTPIRKAIVKDDLEDFRLLIEKCANINLINDMMCWTPLTKAIDSGKIEFVRLLIENGADINMPDPRGRKPIDRAICRGNLEIIKLLIEKGADVSFIQAIDCGKIEFVRLLIENGADINMPDLRGRKPIDRAISRGNLEIINLLIEKGAHISIIQAIDYGKIEFIRHLIENRYDSNLPDLKGSTPLNRAIKLNKLDVVK